MFVYLCLSFCVVLSCLWSRGKRNWRMCSSCCLPYVCARPSFVLPLIFPSPTTHQLHHLGARFRSVSLGSAYFHSISVRRHVAGHSRVKWIRCACFFCIRSCRLISSLHILVHGNYWLAFLSARIIVFCSVLFDFVCCLCRRRQVAAEFINSFHYSIFCVPNNKNNNQSPRNARSLSQLSCLVHQYIPNDCDCRLPTDFSLNLTYRSFLVLFPRPENCHKRIRWLTTT